MTTAKCECCDNAATTSRQLNGETHLCDSCAAEWDSVPLRGDGEVRPKWNQAMGCWRGEEQQAIQTALDVAAITDRSSL